MAFIAINSAFLSLFSQAMMTGILPCAPRPRLPLCLPPINASSNSMVSESQYKLSLWPIAPLTLLNISRAVFQLTSMRLLKRNAEILPLSEPIKYKAQNHYNKGKWLP
jgi:hypothetical protein